MVHPIERDKRRRLLFSSLEKKRVRYKTLLQDASLKDLLKRRLFIRTQKIPRNSSENRTRRRCTLTGRGRGVLRICRLSRIRFRELASQGVLNGVQKASW